VPLDSESGTPLDSESLDVVDVHTR